MCVESNAVAVDNIYSYPALPSIPPTNEYLGAYVVVVLSVVFLSRSTTLFHNPSLELGVCARVVGLVCGCVCNDFFEWMTLH